MGLEQIAVAFFISSLLMLCAFLFSKFIDFIGDDEIGYFATLLLTCIGLGLCLTYILYIWMEWYEMRLEQLIVAIIVFLVVIISGIVLSAAEQFMYGDDVNLRYVTTIVLIYIIVGIFLFYILRYV